VKVSAQAYAILLGAQLAVGSAAIFARYALHGSKPVMISAIRLAIAAVPLLIMSLPAASKSKIPRSHEALFAFAGIALAVHFATWIASLQYVSVAVSTLLVSITPAWTALFDIVVLKQRKSWIFWLALAIAIGGVALIVMDISSPAPVVGQAFLGDVLAIAGSIALAVYLIAIRSIRKDYSTLVIVGRTYTSAAVALAIAALLLQETPPPLSDSVSWGGIIAMGLIPQMLGHTGMNAALRWFSSSTVAFSTLLEPVFAAVLAAGLFAESLSAQTIGGCVLVLTSLAAILKSDQSSAT